MCVVGKGELGQLSYDMRFLMNDPLRFNAQVSQFLNGAGGSPKDRVALNIINTVSGGGDPWGGGLFFPLSSRPARSPSAKNITGRSAGSVEAAFGRRHLRRHGGIHRHISGHALPRKRISRTHVCKFSFAVVPPLFLTH
jgi:hypothetical protein